MQSGVHALLRTRQPSVAIGCYAMHDLPFPCASTGAIAAAAALAVRQLQHRAGNFDFSSCRRRRAARPPPMPWPCLLQASQCFVLFRICDEEALDGADGFLGPLLPCRPAHLPGPSIFHHANRRAARAPPMPWPRPLHASQYFAALRICNDAVINRIGGLISPLLPCRPAHLPGPSIFYRANHQGARAPPMPGPRPLQVSRCLTALRIWDDKVLNGVGGLIGPLFPCRPAHLLPGSGLLGTKTCGELVVFHFNAFNPSHSDPFHKAIAGRTNQPQCRGIAGGQDSITLPQWTSGFHALSITIIASCHRSLGHPKTWGRWWYLKAGLVESSTVGRSSTGCTDNGGMLLVC